MKDFNVALAKGDISFLVENVQDKMSWEVAGNLTAQGKNEYLKATVKHQFWQVKELTVETIITHGPDASVSGQITTVSDTKFSFCDVYRFKGAGGLTIKSIKSFIIQET